MPEPFENRNGWVVFDLPSGKSPITKEMIDELVRADYEEEYQRALSPQR
jgi:hypothetical protein